MLKQSINLYNTRLSSINYLYKKIKKYKGNKKAIVVLLNSKEIEAFIDNNILFLSKKYHDILIFYVTERISLDIDRNMVYRNIQFSIIDISNIFYRFPYKFNESLYIPNFSKRGKWNYQHMCRFFFRDVFFHHSLKNVKFAMRLDSESIVNTTINLFDLMQPNKVYMHNKIMNDDKKVIKELKKFTESYLKVFKIDIKDLLRYRDTFKISSLLYYNNFEICKLSFFRSKEMYHFMNIIDLSYGQFIYRWGDAPLRYISLSLFANNDSKISLPKTIKYCHKHCQ